MGTSGSVVAARSGLRAALRLRLALVALLTPLAGLPAAWAATEADPATAAPILGTEDDPDGRLRADVLLGQGDGTFVRDDTIVPSNIFEYVGEFAGLYQVWLVPIDGRIDAVFASSDRTVWFQGNGTGGFDTSKRAPSVRRPWSRRGRLEEYRSGFGRLPSGRRGRLPPGARSRHPPGPWAGPAWRRLTGLP